MKNINVCYFLEGLPVRLVKYFDELRGLRKYVLTALLKQQAQLLIFNRLNLIV